MSSPIKGGKRPGSGRKPVQIDLEQVEKLCGLQCTDEELASFFGVTVRTIERRKNQLAFAEAIARGKAKGRSVASPESVGTSCERQSGGEYLPGEEPAWLQGLRQQ